MSPCCPTCGRKLAAPRQARKVTAISDGVITANLSDAELFKYYRKTAHVGDVAFMLEHVTMSGALRVRVADLLARAPQLGRTETLREHARNLAAWRSERAAAERARALPVELEAVS